MVIINDDVGLKYTPKTGVLLMYPEAHATTNSFIGTPASTNANVTALIAAQVIPLM